MCQRINLLENDGTFAEKLNALLADARTENYESGYLVYPSEANVFRYEPVRGEPGEASIVFAPQGQVEGLMHSHYGDLFPTFSAADVKAVYDTYNEEHMHDYGTFFCSVVSPNGNAYLLKIEDIYRFLFFSGRYFLHREGFMAFEISYYEKQQAYLQTMGPVGSFEMALCELLEDSGLVLFKATGPFRTWLRLEKDEYGNLREVGCNVD